jgi:DNA-binding MarR family transcriptional regulator
MDATVLIDAIVRQTTVLIAQLATSAGNRASLARTANLVFVDLVRELKEQGLGNKVIADMFGLALRTYHDKVRRLSESTTVQGRSLWEATLEHIQEEETVLQTEVLRRFSHDDESTLRGVLSDLVESGMVFRSGRGASVTYRAAKAEEYGLAQREGDASERAASLVWVAVSQLGYAEANAIAQAVPLDRSTLNGVLDQLVKEGRIARVERGSTVQYSTELCLIPFGAPAGWEAAVFDHYQAVVTAICTKLRLGNTETAARDRIGGSTYRFTVWDGHPHFQEVVDLLGRLRSEAIRLREKVTEFNQGQASPTKGLVRVVAYMGQTVLEMDDDHGGAYS